MAQAVQSQPKSSAPSTRQLVRWGAYAIFALLLILWLAPLIAERSPARMLQTTITGILAGGVYSLVALGIVIINKASGVFNFAHGYMMLWGGFVFYTQFITNEGISVFAVGLLALVTVLMIITMNGYQSLRNPVYLGGGAAAVVVLSLVMSLPGDGLAQWVRAIVGGMLAAMSLGLVIERFNIRPLIGQPLFTSVMMTLAVAEVLRGVIKMIWGSLEVSVPIFATPDPIVPGAFQRLPPIRIDGRESFLDGIVVINQGQLIAFGLSLVAFGIFILFFRYTNVGLAMRATAENQQLAQSVGLRVRVILAIAWGIAAVLAAIAGILQGGANLLSVNATPLLAFAAFPAVLLGGLESIAGALIGGLIIGLLQEWANFLFPGLQAGTELAPYLALMIVLIIRPDGLFGQKRIERI